MPRTKIYLSATSLFIALILTALSFSEFKQNLQRRQDYEEQAELVAILKTKEGDLIKALDEQRPITLAGFPPYQTSRYYLEYALKTYPKSSLNSSLQKVDLNKKPLVLKLTRSAENRFSLELE